LVRGYATPGGRSGPRLQPVPAAGRGATVHL